MKNYLHILAVLMILILGTEMSAQGYQRKGIIRSQTGSQNKQPTDADYLDQSMNKLTSELSLDSFQTAVIRDLIKDEQERESKIITEDIPFESKNEKLIASRELLREKIRDMLNPEQKEKFEKLEKKKK